MGVFSYISLSFSQKQTEQYIETSDLVSRMLALDKLSISLNRNIDNYVSFGYENSVQDIEGIIEQMRVLLKDVSSSSVIMSSYDTLTRIQEQLNVLEVTFKDIIVERNIRTNLITRDMRDAADNLENQLYLLAKDYDSESESVYDIIIVTKTIEKNFFRFLDFYDSSWLEEVSANFDSAKKWVSTNEEKVLLHRGEVFLKELTTNIEHYESIFLRLIQSIRSNLYLENVVMAGASHEINYLSNDLNQKIIEFNSALTQQIQQSSARDRNAVIAASVFATIFGIVFSILISRSITQPIEKITNTFKALAQGDIDTNVPELERKDEIGALARSADVFKSKNSETEKLLAKTKDLAVELDLNRQALEKSNDELEQFVYTVSHDLKSPLVTSSGFISMIQDLYKAGKQEQAFQKLDKVIAANERMGQLINDLLELSRVGRVDLDMELLDMNSIIQEFVEMQNEIITQEGVSLKIQSNLPAVFGNKSRILQIFENLFSNSLKYGKSDNSELEIELGSTEDKNGISLYFKDNGRGIDPEFHAKVFGLFSRLDNDKRGNGIGLAIVQKTMQFHNGKVWIDSKVGEGTCFWLYFPKKELS